MRPRLLQSFLLVFATWLVITTLWWSLMDPTVNQQSAYHLKRLLPFLPFDVPKTVDVRHALSLQILVLKYWTLPILLLSGLTFGLGYGYRWLQAKKTGEERLSREAAAGEYRGLTVSRGVLPLPPAPPMDEIDLGDDNGDLQRMTEAELALLHQILGVISAADAPFAGEAVSVGLLEHAASVVFQALQSRRSPGLGALVAGASELGKLTAYAQINGEWKEVRDHDLEAANTLGRLPAWWDMPQHERLAVMLAVKYRRKPWQMPYEVEGDTQVVRTAKELLTTAADAVEEVKAEAQERALESTSVPDVVFDTFLQCLPTLSFQNRGLPKGVRAVAWKVGNRVFLAEIALRETVMKRLPAVVAASLKPNPKERQRLQPFTIELLRALDARGWLVREMGSIKLGVDEAAWTIKAGKLEFRGIIIVEVPEDQMSQLPSQDSMYEVAVVGPMFAAPGQTAMSMDDLNGLLNMNGARKPPASTPSGPAPAAAPNPEPGE